VALRRNNSERIIEGLGTSERPRTWARRSDFSREEVGVVVEGAIHSMNNTSDAIPLPPEPPDAEVVPKFEDGMHIRENTMFDEILKTQQQRQKNNEQKFDVLGEAIQVYMCTYFWILATLSGRFSAEEGLDERKNCKNFHSA